MTDRTRIEFHAASAKNKFAPSLAFPESFRIFVPNNKQPHAMTAPQNITNAKGTTITLVEQFSGISYIGCTMQAGYVGGKGAQYLVQFFGSKLARIISCGSGKVETVIL